MSSYLVDRIAAQPNIQVLLETQLSSLEGQDGVLESITWRDRSGGETSTPIRHLFVYIGAEPNTHWLAASGLVLDGDGFVQTKGGCTADTCFEDLCVRGVGPRAGSKRSAQSIKVLRARAGLTQEKFAALIEVDLSTLLNWEQGRREPTGPAKALIRAITNDPKHVLKALEVTATVRKAG
jgi:DNA-binding XRE family transcriptional regulator